MAFSLKFFLINSLMAFLTTTTCIKSFSLVPAVFVFGDSLADAGNNNNLSVPIDNKSNFGSYGIDLPRGVNKGRFSNGLNAVDFACKFLGFSRGPPAYLSITNVDQMLQGVNFASAGSGILDQTGPGTLNMATQIKYFEKVVQSLKQKLGERKARNLISRSIFMLVTGNNDLFEYYRKNRARNQDSNSKFVSDLVDIFIQCHIMALQNLGVKNFYITGLGPLGCVPIFRSKTDTGECLEELQDLAKDYNFIAKNQLNIHWLSNPLSFRYAFVDTYGIASTIMAAPWLYGLSEVREACCGEGRLNTEKGCTENTRFCEDRSSYFFWDRYHPTEAGARIMSELGIYGIGIFASPFNLLQLTTGL